ncbi:MAG: hypothetical protein KKB13_27190, partial [Chloroflexi bacterium]|nr:hypothetical protein [Chloroflexota bacterium]
MRWVRQGDRVHVGGQVVVQLEGVGGHLQGHCVLGRQSAAHPRSQVRKADALRAQDWVELGVYPAGYQIVLVCV